MEQRINTEQLHHRIEGEGTLCLLYLIKGLIMGLKLKRKWYKMGEGKKRERDIRVMVPGKNYEETNLAS